MSLSLRLFSRLKYILIISLSLASCLLTSSTSAAPWYVCWKTISWTSPAVVSNTSVYSPTAYCWSDGDGKSRAYSPGAVATSGSMGCYCYDAVAPTSSTTATPASPTWTKNAVVFNGTVGNQTTDGSAFSNVSYACPGSWFTSLGAISTYSFSCSTNSSAVQNAQVMACDVAWNCSTTPTPFYKEITPPAVVFNNITGKIKNHTNTTAWANTTSTLYTYDPLVTLSLSAADTGWSGLKSVLFSCNSITPTTSTDSRWEAYSPTKIFNLTTSNWCTVAQWARSVYIWALDFAGNISAAASKSIIYDITPPTFTTHAQTLLLQATTSYPYTIEYPSDGYSGIRDFSIAWGSDSNGYSMTTPDVVGTSYTFSNFTHLVAGAKRSAVMTITLEDRAGNITTKTQPIDIIAQGLINHNTTTKTLTPMRGWTSALMSDMAADFQDYYAYHTVLKDAFGNIIRPIDNIRTIQPNWIVNNTVKFLDGTLGAVHYVWDGMLGSDITWNSYSSTIYAGSTNKASGAYYLRISSAVPTKQWYSGYTNDEIYVSNIIFSSTIGSCPATHICWSINSSTFPTGSLWDVTAWLTGAPLKAPIAFKPIVDITLAKSFTTLTDNTWYPIVMTLHNNSTSQSFTLNQYELDLRYTKSLFGIADAEIRWDFGAYSSTAIESSKMIPFVFNSAITLTAGSDATKNFDIRTNTYGAGFWQFGFTSFIPYIWPTWNEINASHPTGYNTRSLSIKPILAYSSISSPVPASEFTDGTSVWQKIAIQWLLGDRQKWNTTNTLENAISVDTSKLNKMDFKASIQKNVASMTRWLASEVTSPCNVNLPTNLTKDIYYYDFSNLSAGSSINGNNGCILTIWGVATNFGGQWFDTLKITGKKTIIVRWWNILINADMYYNDPKSILALVVLRSDTDRKKWWNILIDPKVTNIVGGTYAEGSIMSYHAWINKLYDSSNTDEGDLSRQLHWYGNIFSSNSVGWSFKAPYECPYDSDIYQSTKTKSCSQAEASKYDLAFLRRFVTIPDGIGSCAASVTNKAAKSTGMNTIDYAFAGKRRCFQSNPTNNGLRWSDKIAPVIIEYNPAIQTSDMKIFSTK